MDRYLEMTPFIEKLRLYDQPGGYDARAPYIGSLDVTWISFPTEAHLSGACGVLDRSDYEKAFVLLKAQGVKTVTYERHGEKKTREL